MASPLQRLGRRVMMALGLARQTSDTDESRSTPTMQLALAAGEMRSDVPLLQEYGFRSRPTSGCDAAVLFQGGDRTRGVVIATGDQRHPPPGLQRGEVCVFSPTMGSSIIMKADGSISIDAGEKKINVACGGMNVSGDITSTGTITGQKDVMAGNISLTDHTHPVTAAPGETGAPEG
ncbi:putative bacteriophage related protein [Acetobacter pasteurianus subsp. pasteurianus LMG 1262 = NBRC 106471]|uniref:phage baseplate assembly protein domain-containing protein n=1 Tax=Acetobacter pasteurianus TaxID=438 RepID=UPI000245801A|nr:phage baseplate assembly protein [Acetobacter pasteurianus]GAB31459.1 putative bacteriophage related protein [Acetobacter pasteurianus subsp. pasteurianus LMG 1262 = NBRC 106471]GCD50089.1 bacteriophage protein [Acetobacter pasteurianus subsp. pasteurianus LMG 1262 = NBRC 106471]